MQALREIGFRVYGIGKPQPQTDAETTSAEATARGRKRCPNPNPNPNLTLTAWGRKRGPRPAVLAQRADAYCAAAATVWRLRLLRLVCLLGAYSAYWAAAYLRRGYYCAAAAGLASGPRHPVVPPGCSPTWAAIAHLARLAFMRGEAAPGMRDGRMPCGRPTLAMSCPGHISVLRSGRPTSAPI